MSASQTGGLVGSSIGPYRVVRRLGQGATGFVYEAIEVEEQVPVALKLFAGIVDPLGRERFLQEAQLASRIQHPNLAPIFDAGESDGKLYIAYELMDPKDLEQVLRQSLFLPASEAVDVAAQVAAGLGALHRAQIVHRDVKPANVFRRPSTGQWVLGDLGIAKDRSGHSLRTGSGIMVGTPEYMAPEYVVGDAAGEASDQYSLGVLLFEMLSGRLPFEGLETEELFQRLQRDEVDPTPLPDRADLRAVVMRMVARDPEQRFRSITEAEGRLRALPDLASCPRPPLAEKTLTRPDTLGRRRRDRGSTGRTRLALPPLASVPPRAWLALAAGLALVLLLWYLV